jgi:hypothetical protein
LLLRAPLLLSCPRDQEIIQEAVQLLLEHSREHNSSDLVLL